MPQANPPSEDAGMSPVLLAGLTMAVGVIVLPLFAAQPLVGLIGPSLGLPLALAGLAPTLTLLGYATGLVVLVPLVDLLESRRLILSTLAADMVAIGCAAAATTPLLFLIAAFAVGVATCAIQMLIPVAAAITPEHRRGRIIGTVMSGLMIGILLSRPAASLVADHFGWRLSYAFDAAAIAGLIVMLFMILPRHKPVVTVSYGGLVRSLWTILLQEPVLRRRAFYQALCMAAFGSFWTAVALRLAEPPFQFSQTGIAVFALAGAGGAIVSPLAGRAGDLGLTNAATRMAHAAVIGAFILAGVAGAGWLGFEPARHVSLAIVLIGAAAFVLDLGVIGDQTLGRRAINLLRPEARGRINGLFTGLFFVGSATGSALSSLAWVVSGWSAVCALGLVFAVTAFVVALREPGVSDQKAPGFA